MNINNAEGTNYARLYRNTYWGGHALHVGENAVIISNRNAFADVYRLEKNVRHNIPQYIQYHLGYTDEWSLPTDINRQKHRLDHTEVYRDKDGNYVLVNSPYHHYEPEFVERWGWKEVAPLYNLDAKTLVKVVQQGRGEPRRARWLKWHKRERRSSKLK